ncbi:MAG: hypothetical protein NC409_11110 [Clostridium sp.]|nr:hypothetical protein [Clostridium sp.]
MEENLISELDNAIRTTESQNVSLIFENSTFEEIANIDFDLPQQCWKKE